MDFGILGVIFMPIIFGLVFRKIIFVFYSNSSFPMFLLLCICFLMMKSSVFISDFLVPYQAFYVAILLLWVIIYKLINIRKIKTIPSYIALSQLFLLYLFETQSTKLVNNNIGKLGIRIFYIYWILQFFFILPHKLSPFPGPWFINPCPMLSTVVLFGSNRTKFFIIFL